MTLEEIYGELSRLVDEMRDFLDTHEDEDGNLSEEDEAIYNVMNAKLKALQKKVARFEEITKVDNYLSQPTSKRILTNPGEFGDGWDIGGDNYGVKNMKQKNVSGVRGTTYHREFFNGVRTGFKKVKAEYLNEGNLNSGGYLLPVEFHEQIITELTAENIFRQIGRVIPTASTHKIPLLTTAPTATWVGEGEEIQFSKTQFGQVSLNAFKLAVAVKASRELIEDAYYPVEDFLAHEFGAQFAKAEENAMLNGTGDGQPKGILTLLSESASSTLQTNGAELTADDLLTLQYSVDRVYRGKSVWLASDATLAQIRRLKTADQGYIWEPSMQAEEPPKIFGRPVYTSNFLPSPTAGNICVLFGNFSDYFLIGERGEREFQPLREIFALSGQVAYLMTERLDSAFVNLSAIRGLKIRG